MGPTAQLASAEAATTPIIRRFTERLRTLRLFVTQRIDWIQARRLPGRIEAEENADRA